MQMDRFLALVETLRVLTISDDFEERALVKAELLKELGLKK